MSQKLHPVRLDDGEVIKIKEYYKYELAAKYSVSIERFNEYYLEPVITELLKMGFVPKKTRKLSLPMVRTIVEFHGSPE